MAFSSSDRDLKNEARKSYGLPDIFKIKKDNLCRTGDQFLFTLKPQVSW
jgi:hypothetical protein